MILQLCTSTVLACVLCNPILVAGKTIGKPKIKWIGFRVFELELKTETLTAEYSQQGAPTYGHLVLG